MYHISMKSLLAIILLLIGCARGPAVVTMPAEVEAYYYEFFQIVGSFREQTGTIDFDYSKSVNGVAAYCVISPLKPFKIRFNRDVWLASNDDLRRIYVFHELTHCIFRAMSHSSDPLSYMYYAPVQETESELDFQLIKYTRDL